MRIGVPDSNNCNGDKPHWFTHVCILCKPCPTLTVNEYRRTKPAVFASLGRDNFEAKVEAKTRSLKPSHSDYLGVSVP